MKKLLFALVTISTILFCSCKDNGKKPQDFESLNEYLTEICENA
jgi:hypothetical protein